jgi:signal peptidase I
MIDLREPKEFLKDTLSIVLTAVAVLLFIVYIGSVQQVVGPSMEPTLKEGDILILNKIGYKLFDVKRFDVVAVKTNTSKYFVKRVIGLPGDKIEYIDNVLHINGKGYKESFLAKDTITENFSIKDLGYDEIPEDMYLVLGDNRSNSDDSRNPKIGLIKKDEILGKSSLRIFPFKNFGLFE